MWLTNLLLTFRKPKAYLCPKCRKNDELPDHYCSHALTVWGIDNPAFCTCCEDCIVKCRLKIDRDYGQRNR